ncbi:MAG TPA: hypothetical protein VF622_10570 [Segetibacter sp.]|jgi:hypothetical protein
MREPFFTFLLLTTSKGQLSVQSHIVSGRVTDRNRYSLAGAIVSAVRESVGTITTATPKKKSRSNNNSAVYPQNALKAV